MCNALHNPSKFYFIFYFHFFFVLVVIVKSFWKPFFRSALFFVSFSFFFLPESFGFVDEGSFFDFRQHFPLGTYCNERVEEKEKIRWRGDYDLDGLIFFSSCWPFFLFNFFKDTSSWGKPVQPGLTQPFGYLWIVHFRIVLGHFTSLSSRPDHECVHRPLDVIVVDVVGVPHVSVHGRWRSRRWRFHTHCSHFAAVNTGCCRRPLWKFKKRNTVQMHTCRAGKHAKGNSRNSVTDWIAASVAVECDVRPRPDRTRDLIGSIRARCSLQSRAGR